ncbi:MAG: hypothetical protein KF757_11510 [Phycisphaeraceae bacterium]|nr:hypothetical protein [Phycisphaeraceae bacterium]MCW5762314.1 hypothetical protein [Phycisphaeraceae bacterium]
MKRVLIGCAVGLASVASGQSINIDLGTEAGTPGSGYAAAGHAGYWNDALHGEALDLKDLNGNPTGVSIILPHDFSTPITDPNLAGGALALLGDAMSGFGDVMAFIQFSGLAPGIYDVFAYGYSGGGPFEATLFQLQSYYQNLSGPYTGTLVEGVTHAHFFLQVNQNGTLELGVVGGFWGSSGYVSGFQLVHEPCLADSNRDGVLDFFDVSKYLSWFSSGNSRADLNFDNTLDFADVQLFLQVFSAGCP